MALRHLGRGQGASPRPPPWPFPALGHLLGPRRCRAALRCCPPPSSHPFFAFAFWAADMALPAASAGVGGAIGPFLGSRGASAICPGSGSPFTAGLRLGLLPLGGLPSVGLPACPGGPPRNGLSAIGHGSRGFLASVSRPRPNHVFTGPGRSGALDLRSLAGPGRRGAPKPFCILLGPGCQRAPKVFYTVRGARWRRGPECVSRTWNGTTWHGLGRPCAAWQGSALFLLVRSN